MEPHELKALSPDQIERNTENPRLHFPREELEKLSESIARVGVLVPVSVYEKALKGKKRYILVDGERRWICSKELGLKQIPAIIIPKPDRKDNILTMFHIHLVRDAWDDMPTAWALQKVVDRTGVDEPEKLRELTGLSVQQIRRLLFATRLPVEYQKLIDSGKVPLNFFSELQANVLDPLAKFRPAIYKKYGQSRILRAFVRKKLDNIIADTVDLRQVRPIIKVASEEASSPEAKSDLDGAIVELIERPKQTIQATYENTVEMVVEAEKFGRQCAQLVKRFDRLMRKTKDAGDKKLVINSVESLVSSLRKRLARF
ncbi:MAG TPA: ParB/RepB/Spo0J family partition protein [Chthoniobacterales bacterium]